MVYGSLADFVINISGTIGTTNAARVLPLDSRKSGEGFYSTFRAPGGTPHVVGLLLAATRSGWKRWNGWTQVEREVCVPLQTRSVAPSNTAAPLSHTVGIL